MNVQHPEKHLFSVFWPDTSHVAQNLVPSERVKISDAQLIHRISRVLRLKLDEQFIFFDRSMHLICTIADISSTVLTCLVIKKAYNVIPDQITVLLPILKKDALEQAIYGLAEIGMSEIILVDTAKSYGKLNQKDLDRLLKIVIAAAEQSKNFRFPGIKSPKPLSEIISNLDSIEYAYRLLCDAHASKKLIGCVDTKNRDQSYIIAIGPEADFIRAEKEQFIKAGWTQVRLLDSILRAQDAAFLAVGILRHMLF